jgi:hypothetical protein
VKYTLALLVCLFCSSLTWATCFGSNPQMCTNYGTANPTTVNDNLAYATTHNTWHQLASTPSLSKIAVGPYAAKIAVYATDSAGNAWEYLDPLQGGSGTWLEHSEMGTDNLSFSIGGGVLARIRKSTTGCSSGHAVDTWSGTAWTAKAGICAFYLSAAAKDGTLYALEIVSGSQLAYYFNGAGWAQLSGGPYQSIAGFNSADAYANDTAGGIWQRQASNSTAMTKLVGITDQGSGPLYVDNNHEMWKLFGNQVLHWDMVGGAWDRFVSNTFTALAGGGRWNVYALTSTGVYRLNLFSITESINVTGNTTCSTGCPGNPLHYAKADMRFAHSMTGGGQIVTGPGVPPTTNVNVTATDTTWDPIGCADGSPCIQDGSASGTVTCSIMGIIYTFTGGGGGGGGLQPFDIEEAFTRLRWTGGAGEDCAKSNIVNRWFCNFPVITYCTADTIPPDWIPAPPEMRDLSLAVDGNGNRLPVVGFGWDAANVCVRLKALRGTGAPWSCPVPWGISVSILGDLDDMNTVPAECTHNH